MNGIVWLKFEVSMGKLLIFMALPRQLLYHFDELADSEITEIRELQKVIAIDEYKGDTREGKYQLIIYDVVTKESIETLSNRF